MGVSDRQKNILDTIIREYIDTALPVSSQCLGKKYDFGICPASIRIEMQKLTDDGYLCQPHTSAGRIPTDKGYRSFVDSLLEGEEQLFAGLDFDAAKDLDDDFSDMFKMANSLIRDMASASSSLVVGYLRQEDMLLKEGWEELLQKPEFTEKDLVADFISYLEYLEDGVKSYKPEEKLDIFIGSENPFSRSKSRDFSTIAFSCQPSEKEEMILAIVGPKRMAYDKNIALINNVIKLFENY